MLALDFDGVICDGLDECLLVTWNSHHGKDLDAFGDAGLSRLPSAFVERFLSCRAFARHLGHFLVPLVTSEPIRSQREFDAHYAALDQRRVDAFMTAAGAYRERARSERGADWLRYHSLYPGIRELLERAPAPVYIVTAKDAESVLRILAGRRITVDPARVFGGLTAKLDALATIARRERVARSEVTFLDDSIANVIDAHRAGYEALWATWGYHAAEHVDTAHAAGVTSLTLADLVQGQLRR